MRSLSEIVKVNKITPPYKMPVDRLKEIKDRLEAMSATPFTFDANNVLNAYVKDVTELLKEIERLKK